MLGKTEDLVIILLIILVIFGAKKIPQLARAAGESARELRKGLNGEPSDVKKSETDAKPAAASDKAA